MSAPAVWMAAGALSLALHGLLAFALSGLSGASPGIVLAELRIADDSGFAVTLVRPVAQSAGIVGASAVKPLVASAPIATPRPSVPVTPTRSEQIAAVAPTSLASATPPVALAPAGPADGRVSPGPATVPPIDLPPQSLEPRPAIQLSPVGSKAMPWPDRVVQPSAPSVPAPKPLLEPQPAAPLSAVVSEALPQPPEAVPVLDGSAVRPSAIAPSVPTPAPLSGVASTQAIEKPIGTASVFEESVETSVSPQPAPVLEAAETAAEPMIASSPKAIAAPATAAPRPLAPVEQQLALAPAVRAPASLAERLRNFVRFYDGGNCFFAVPVSLDRKPRIDGFGSAVAPILAFGAELRDTLGIEAEISVRQITGRQCPAISFLGGLLNSRLPELDVRLARDRISSGGELQGVIAHVRLPWLRLLLVDDDGLVHDISSYLHRTEDGWSFSAPVYVTAQGHDRNQLIVAVASSQVLARLELRGPAAGASLFPAVLGEADATRNDIAIGIGAFQVE